MRTQVALEVWAPCRPASSLLPACQEHTSTRGSSRRHRSRRGCPEERARASTCGGLGTVPPSLKLATACHVHTALRCGGGALSAAIALRPTPPRPPTHRARPRGHQPPACRGDVARRWSPSKGPRPPKQNCKGTEACALVPSWYGATRQVAEPPSRRTGAELPKTSNAPSQTEFPSAEPPKSRRTGAELPKTSSAPSRTEFPSAQVPSAGPPQSDAR